ncbi:MAG TPA: hypothetical protein VF753_17105 [Terriglobales bacterium]
MKHRILPLWNLIVILGVFVGTPQISRANDSRAHTGPQISGAYQLLQKTDQGAKTRVRLQVRLVNHGQRDLHVQRVTLWDSRHPEKGATQACSIVIPAGRSADITQQFVIGHPEIELWQRGSAPRLVLEMQSPNGRRTTESVRLSQTSGRKGE